ncbi:MAG TPA: DJ-1/PfpI family protein [bacterium]|nr:DJ-1/PfpI family protein [bacterium]HMW32666.1 DJ-1/PfpI family protein [bacterium]HMW35845.1 DJ-1/PfpI family protein [bacterium]HMY36984.1 DJ-1/PfpI family protein [bacterium]HMZ02968.1 DJ-1/PfpI family protein [bacterium]
MASQKIVFLILPEVHLLDLGGPEQVFLEAIGYGAPFEIEYCTYTKELRSSGGLTFGHIKHFSEVAIKPEDYIFIPGPNVRSIHDYKFTSQTELLDWLRRCYRENITLCSVCSGAFALAYAGLLDYKKCTTHFKRTAELKRYFPKLDVQENVLFVEDGNIITSAGIASGIDMALYILERIQGSHFAHKVAREMVIYTRRTGSQPQKSSYLDYRNHIHSGIHKVQDYLSENIHKKSSVGHLAEIACMSERNFTRIFKKEAGITVNEYTTLVRKEKIKLLLKNPDLSRVQIARAVGLNSDRQLSRIMHSI